MDVKYYCGTCQLQLIDTNENDDNYVNIVEHPQLLDFIAHNITANRGHQYHSCLQKWQDFQNYCLIVIQSYDNLKKVLQCEKLYKPATNCGDIRNSEITAEQPLVEVNAINNDNHVLTSCVNTANALILSKELPGLREGHPIRNVEAH
ncbi:uncharacterized protein LOC119636664 [Glossina fuscipes]|uniref:Uncharacterized protein LOC119636664 n=1 Tax=Glossina fuscipes TaxID=7396 RepID=A0A9C5Z5E7_9MUSC|nr:uncharacterized protein LOC119636664 [Glossina fuscipes]